MILGRPPPWLFAAFALLGAARVEAEDRALARGHYERALALINVGDHRGAIDEFRKAYVEAAFPSFLYNIGFEYEGLGRGGGDEPAALDDLSQAIAFYERYLQARPDATDRAEVQLRIGALREELARRKQRAAATSVERAAGAASAPAGLSTNRPAPESAMPIVPSVPAAPSPPAAAPSRWKLWLGVGGGAAAVVAGVTLAVVLTRPHETVLTGVDLTRP